MEIVGPTGSKTLTIEPGQTREFGRGNGFDSGDKTVSRRHVSFILSDPDQTRVGFEVVGANPIWVHSSSSNGEVKAYRRSEKGEMQSGDMFCVSSKNPVWFSLKTVGQNWGKNERDEKVRGQNEREDKVRSQNENSESLQSVCGFEGVEDLQLESVDISDIDPVKEFGFLVMGHEFDAYPKKMIRDIKNWDWFLEEPGEDSDGDEAEGKRMKRGGRSKRKKGQANDDEEWTGDEDDEELTKRAKPVPRAKYSTRSKDKGKPKKDGSKSKCASGKKSRDVEEEDEEDETLGGFIVDDVDLEEEEEVEDEEEEFEDDLDEDEE